MVAQLDARLVRHRPGRAAARLLAYGAFEGRPLTTRGRAVNPVVLAHLRAAARWGPVRDDVRPVFIVGMGRSGTTLLGRLFSAHRAVGFLNEPKAVWHVVEPDEDLVGSYTTGPARLRFGAGDATGAAAGRLARIHGWFATLSRSSVIADKYPELVFRTEWVRALADRAVFVVIVRHPGDVITSVRRWSAAHRTDGADWWGARDRKWWILWRQGIVSDDRWAEVAASVDPARAPDHHRAAVEWLLSTDAAVDLLERDPGAVLVRYEDLVAEPATVMAGVFEACGLPPDPVALRYAQAVTSAAPSRRSGTGDLPAALAAAVRSVGSRLGYG